MKPLMVMLTAEFEGGSRHAAGIVFAHKGGRLYVATARHAVWEGATRARSVQARFSWLTGDSVPAIVTEHADAALDLGVLSIEAAPRKMPSLPFASVSYPAGAKRGDKVFRMGHPYGRRWFSRPAPDTVAEVGDMFVAFDGELQEGYSGGGLFDSEWRLAGMLKQDSPPNGEAVAWHRIEKKLLEWGYAVELLSGREPAGPPAGEVRVNRDGDGMRYVWIPPGQFTLGCSAADRACDPDERPAVPGVHVSGHWMSQTEVTVDAYRRFATATGITMPPETTQNPGWREGQQPVMNVSWEEAKRYCEVGAKGRLPTEAEWEYAARAGSGEVRYGAPDEIAWSHANSGGKPRPVGGKARNAWNLYDMLGNVSEWTADWHESGYYRWLLTARPKADPAGPPRGAYRVMRGGGWGHDEGQLRFSERDRLYPEVRNHYLGIRCVRVEIVP